MRPITTIERDESIKAYEVAIESEDERHDLFKILFFDNGRTEVRRWTTEELEEELSTAIVGVIEEVVRRKR